MLRVAGRRLSSLSWLSAQPSSAALASRNPFALADSSSNARTPSDSFPSTLIQVMETLRLSQVISPCNYYPFNQIRSSVTCGTVEPHIVTVRNIVRNVTAERNSYPSNCAKNPEGPLFFRGEGRRCFHSFRHNHFGLFAPLGSEQAAAQHQGSARRFYRGEKRPSTTPDRNRNIRDHKRRLLAAKYELRRNLYKALCRDPNLPSAMRVKHRCKLSKLPRNSSFVRVTNRCIFSGRSRGVYKKFRMSRIVFRTLANQGQLMGVKKASW